MRAFTHIPFVRIAHKSLACLLVFCIVNMPVWALDAGDATVSVGNASVTNPASNTVSVDLISNRAVLDWTQMNATNLETLNFNGTSGFAVLNRVASAVDFNGALNGIGGHIFVVSPHGIVIGPDATITASSFTASGLNITNGNFMNSIYKFSGDGIGEVANYGHISAAQVALIGKKILNAGTISSPGGYTVLASGDSVYLSPEGSDIVVEVASVTVPENPAIDGLGDVVNEGTIEAIDGQIILAAGDTFSRAIDGIEGMTVAVKSGTGRVGQFGTLTADGSEGDGGSITLTAANAVVLGSESATTANAGANGDGGEITAYSPDTTLFSKNATVQAKGGNESGNGGFVEVSGKEHVEIWGLADTTAAAGNAGTFLIDPTNIKIFTSNSPGMIWHEDSLDFYQDGTSWVENRLDYSLLQDQLALSNVTVRTDGTGTDSALGWIWVHPDIPGITWDTDNTLRLDANGQIWVYAPITNTGSGRFEAVSDGHNKAHIAIGDNITAGSIFIQAGNPGIDTDAESNLTIKNGVTLEATSGNIDLLAREDITIDGDVIAKQGSIGINADTDMRGIGSINASGGNIDAEQGSVAIKGRVVTVNTVHAYENIEIVSLQDPGPAFEGGGLVNAEGLLSTDSGDIDIMVKAAPQELDKFGEPIFPESDELDPEGLIILGDNVAANNNVTLHNNTELNGVSDSQFIDAGRTLTAEGYVRKVTEGDMFLLGQGENEGGLSLNFRYVSDDESDPAISTYQGNIWMIGAKDIQIGGDITTFGEGFYKELMTLGSDNGYEGCPRTGGVLIYSIEGSIFTGAKENGLNVNVTGNSDHWNDLGVFNPYHLTYHDDGSIGFDDFYGDFGAEGKAAIVIASAKDLILGPDGSLNAFGQYYDDVDDRTLTNSLAKDGETIGGHERDEGNMYDWAIYTRSIDGDVHVDMQTQILSCEAAPVDIIRTVALYEGDYLQEEIVHPTSKGTMVVDAYDAITFGGNFKDSLANGDVGGSLEVVSRVSEWLEDAYGRLPYAENPDNGPFQNGYDYVMRGAGLANPGIDDGRAWVLESRDVAPLQKLEYPVLSGCPAEMAAAAAELAVNSDQLQMMIANAMASNPNTQPCDACANLLTAAATLKQMGNSPHVAALAQMFNTLAPIDAPYTPEVSASIQTALADFREMDSRLAMLTDEEYQTYQQSAMANELVDAFVSYVAVLENDLKLPVGDSVAMVLEKYGDTIEAAGNPNIGVYLIEQMETTRSTDYVADASL